MSTSAKRVHILQHPLRIASANQHQYYFLPAGTVLYYDASTPEGADRFFVYVNVEGKPLDLTELPRPDMIVPLTAHRAEPEDIANALTDYPVTKDDLMRMLNAKPLTARQAQEIVDHLQQYIRRVQ